MELYRIKSLFAALACVIITILVGANVVFAQTPADELKKEVAQFGMQKVTEPDYKPGIVKHLVLFRYKDTVTESQKADVIKHFLALQNLAQRNGTPYILSIETGTQNSGEGVDHGLEQGFIVTFKSQGDRNYYVGQPVITDPHFYDPAHQAFKDFVGPLLNEPVATVGVVVFDFCVTALTYLGQ